MGQRTDNSPSIDRLVPSKGYTPDNIRVISWRANRLKQEATLEDLRALVAYVECNTVPTEEIPVWVPKAKK